MSPESVARLLSQCAPGKNVRVVTRDGSIDLPRAPEPVASTPIPEPPSRDESIAELRAAINGLALAQQQLAEGLRTLAQQEREVTFIDGEKVISRPIKGVTNGDSAT